MAHTHQATHKQQKTPTARDTWMRNSELIVTLGDELNDDVALVVFSSSSLPSIVQLSELNEPGNSVFMFGSECWGRERENTALFAT